MKIDVTGGTSGNFHVFYIDKQGGIDQYLPRVKRRQAAGSLSKGRDEGRSHADCPSRQPFNFKIWGKSMKSFSLRKTALAVAIGASISSLAFAGITTDSPVDSTGPANETTIGGAAVIGADTAAPSVAQSGQVAAATPGHYYVYTNMQHVTVTNGTQGQAIFDETTGDLTLVSGESESYGFMAVQRQEFDANGDPVPGSLNYGYALTDATGNVEITANTQYTSLGNNPGALDFDPTSAGFNGPTANPDEFTQTTNTGGVLFAYGVGVGSVVPAVPESSPGAGDGVPASGAALQVNPNTSSTALGSINAAGNLNGIQTSATETVISGGTGTTYVTVNDDGVTLSDHNGAPVTLTGVANGVNQYDAVNMGQLDDFQTSINAQLGGFAYSVNKRIKNLKEDAFSGIASALALSSAQMPSAPGKTAVSIGGGFYKSEQAVGLNVVHAVSAWGNNNGTIGLGIASGTSGGNTAGKISVGFEF